MSPRQEADLVLLNGHIVTMDEAGTVASAVAVRDGRIARVGTVSEVKPLIGDQTIQIDLQGKVALPGFIDAHTHIDCTAAHTKLAFSCHIPPVDYVETRLPTGSREAILNRVQELAQELPAGEWIIGQGRFALETDGNSPTREELDRIAPDHPVMIRYSAHCYRLNSKALEVSGMGPESPAPAELEKIAPGAMIVRDLWDWEPTGRVIECIDWMFPMRNIWSYQQLKGAIEQTCREAARCGVTGIHEFTSWPETPRIYQELRREGKLPLRVQLCPAVWGLYKTVDLDALLKLGVKSGFGDEWVKFGSAKIFVDVEGRDARGVYRKWPRITQAQLDELVARAPQVGIRVMMHAPSRLSKPRWRGIRASTTGIASSILQAIIGPRAWRA